MALSPQDASAHGPHRYVAPSGTGPSLRHGLGVAIAMVESPRLVAFGEALLRYSVPIGQRIETARTLTVHPAGAELNVAVDLAHLGWRVRFVSALPDNPLGRLALRVIRSHGVEAAGHLAAPGRMGVFYYEPGAAPRGGEVTYDRADSAFSRFPWHEYNWEEAIDAHSVFLTSGITPALSPQAAAGVQAALRAAKGRAKLVAFDVNYRSKLWSPAEAREAIVPLLAYVDCLFVSADDAVRVLGAPPVEPEAMLPWLADRFSLQGVAMVYNPTPSPGAAPVQWRALVWRAGKLAAYDQPAGVMTIDRLGAGDAFAAGVLWTWMQGRPVQDLARYGSAMMALKCTFEGDFCPVSAQELERAATHSGAGVHR